MAWLRTFDSTWFIANLMKKLSKKKIPNDFTPASPMATPIVDIVLCVLTLTNLGRISLTVVPDGKSCPSDALAKSVLFQKVISIELGSM